jgi:lipopolysaccharide transport system permease protein
VNRLEADARKEQDVLRNARMSFVESPAPGKAAEASWDLDIEAGKGEFTYWRDLWRYRELFYFLAWRDILVRYKQTVIGVGWALLQPLVTTIVLTVVFGKLAKFPSGGVPYPVFVFAAMLPWQFFSRAFSEAGNSLIADSNLISKIYFPRLIVPATSVVTALIDFLISAAFLAPLMAWYLYMPGWRVFTLPLFLLLAFAAAIGFGLWAAALNVSYRDFRYVVPFVVQIGTYISPVGFSSAIVPSRFRLLYSLNPLVGIIDGFRWALLGEPLYVPGLLLSAGIVMAVAVTGTWYFRTTEKRFADII